jgi:peroxiredoxin
MNKNLIVAIAVILVLGVGGYFVFSRKGASPPRDERAGVQIDTQPAQVAGSFVKGQSAPDVAFTDFDGNTHNLSDFAGQVVVLDFWAAWCPFCLEEMPELQAAQDRYGDKLIMIGVHRTDTEKAIRGLKFAEDRGVSYLLVSDTDGALYRAAGGFGMPVAVFIDRNGVVTEVKSGPKTTQEIEEKVGNLVGSM